MPSKVPSYRPPGAPRDPAEARRRYDAGADRAADKRFYASARWLAARLDTLRRRPLCEDCATRGETTAAAHVHHERPRRERPDLAFEPSNLVALCVPCHNARDVR